MWWCSAGPSNCPERRSCLFTKCIVRIHNSIYIYIYIKQTRKNRQYWQYCIKSISHLQTCWYWYSGKQHFINNKNLLIFSFFNIMHFMWMYIFAGIFQSSEHIYDYEFAPESASLWRSVKQTQQAMTSC